METFEMAGVAIDSLRPYLPAVAQSAAGVDQTPAHRLYLAVAGAFVNENQQRSLMEFLHAPKDDALVKLIVRQAMHDQPELAADVATALAAMPAFPPVGTVARGGQSAPTALRPRAAIAPVQPGRGVRAFDAVNRGVNLTAKVVTTVLWLIVGMGAFAAGQVLVGVAAIVYLTYLWVFGGRWLIY